MDSKNNKSSGMQLHISKANKYSPAVVYEKIGDIYNNIEATGKNPNEITHGI